LAKAAAHCTAQLKESITPGLPGVDKASIGIIIHVDEQSLIDARLTNNSANDGHNGQQDKQLEYGNGRKTCQSIADIMEHRRENYDDIFFCQRSGLARDMH
jgi:hypothetical protein